MENTLMERLASIQRRNKTRSRPQIFTLDVVTLTRDQFRVEIQANTLRQAMKIARRSHPNSVAVLKGNSR